jgi:hypothetical protein
MPPALSSDTLFVRNGEEMAAFRLPVSRLTFIPPSAAS